MDIHIQLDPNPMKSIAKIQLDIGQYHIQSQEHLGLRKKIGGSQTTTGGGHVQRVTPTATAHSSSKRRRRIGVHGNGAQKATRMLSVLLTVLLQCYSAMLNC